MRVEIKQTVVRWVSAEVNPNEYELDPEMLGEDLEGICREILWERVGVNGWDGEDVLEESYEEKDET